MAQAALKTPLVSVCIPTYNCARYLGEAIESVLDSYYTHFELIIVDDGSKDGTVPIIQEYLGKDKRIQLFINQINLGDYPNRNKAVSLAKGKYIMFCDSDDYYFPDTISYCVSSMEKFPHAKAGLYLAHHVTDPLTDPFIIDKATLIRKHFFGTPLLTIGPGGSIMHRDFFNAIGGYPAKYGPANDMYFNLKVCCETAILLLPKLFLHYRIHEDQEKNNAYSYIHNNYRYLSDALAELNLELTNKELNYLKKKNDRRFAVNLFRHLMRTKDIGSARQLWRKAGFNLKNLVSGVFHL